MEQSWQRMKDQILSTWAGLSETDLNKTRGSLGEMVTLIHDATGEDRTAIRQKVTTFL